MSNKIGDETPKFLGWIGILNLCVSAIFPILGWLGTWCQSELTEPYYTVDPQIQLGEYTSQTIAVSNPGPGDRYQAWLRLAFSDPNLVTCYPTSGVTASSLPNATGSGYAVQYYLGQDSSRPLHPGQSFAVTVVWKGSKGPITDIAAWAADQQLSNRLRGTVTNHWKQNFVPVGTGVVCLILFIMLRQNDVKRLAVQNLRSERALRQELQLFRRKRVNKSRTSIIL